MAHVVLEGTSGSGRVPRSAEVTTDGTLATISIFVPDRSRVYETVRLSEAAFLGRLRTLDAQEVRLPCSDSEKDVMVARSDNDVWMWVRHLGRDDGGADVLLPRAQLCEPLGVSS